MGPVFLYSDLGCLLLFFIRCGASCIFSQRREASRLSAKHAVVLIFTGLIFEGEIFSEREISHVVHV